MQWLLRVLHVADTTLPTGTTFVLTDEALLGRSPDASIRVDHASVSRHHLRWCTLGDDTIELTNLSRSSAVFLDGSPLSPGQTQRGPAPARLQLGAVLFEIEPLAATEPYAQRLDPSPGDAAPHEALFEVIQDGDAFAIRCRGRFVDLPPTACRLFARLARQSSIVVHHWDLQDAVGPGGNLAQLSTLVRRGLRDLIDAGVVEPAELRELIRASSGSGRMEDLDDNDTDALLRRLILSRRGHGYVLCMPPGSIRFLGADD
jgi:hypothetical protein